MEGAEPGMTARVKIRSMTGFGRGAARHAGVQADVEITSVNRRQFDAQVNLPREFASLEPRIRTCVGNAFTRGRITVSVRLAFSSAACRTAVRVNEPLAQAGIDAVRTAAARMGLPDDLGASWLLRVPGWVVFEPPGGDAETAWPAVEKACGRALRALNRMRETEGRALGRDLARLLAALRGRVNRIQRRAPAVPRRYRARLAASLKEIGLNGLPDDGRLAREVAVMAERADIREELTRLNSHADQALEKLRGPEPCGRTLDFLAQEMGREINTIGSKAGDAVIAADVVAFKAELEQLREQVQNIE